MIAHNSTSTAIKSFLYDYVLAVIDVCPDGSQAIGFEGTIVASAGNGTDFECTQQLTGVLANSVIAFELTAQTLNADCDVNYLEVTTSVDTHKICPAGTDMIYRYHTTTDDITVKYKTTNYEAAHTFSLIYKGKLAAFSTSSWYNTNHSIPCRNSTAREYWHALEMLRNKI